LRILITGVKGFLGSNLLASLREMGGYELYGLGTKEEFLEGIKVYTSKDLDSIGITPELIIMCHAAVASGNTILCSERLFESNVKLTERIVNKFQKSSIIYISTASVYNIKETVINEASSLNPQSDYSISKLWGERVLASNKKISIIRLSSLYGIGMKENTLIPNFINQAIKNNLIEIWGDGSRVQNYIHINDAVRLINCLIMKYDAYNGEILLGVSHIHYSNFEIAQIIASITKSDFCFVDKDDSNSLIYDNNYTMKLLGWKCEERIEEKLNEYIKWKKEEF